MYKKIFIYYIFSLIVMGGVLIRLYKVRNPVADWHSWRQVDTASVTQNYINSGVNLFYPKYHDISSIQTGFYNPQGYRFVEFPLFNLLHVVIIKVLPKVEFDVAGRLVSISASVLTIICLYLLGKYIGGVSTGIMASFFYAFIPFNIYFTRVILPDPLSTALAVLSVTLLVYSIKLDKVIFLYAASIIFSLAMLVKPFAIFYSVPMISLYFWKYGFKKSVLNTHIWISLVIALVPFLLWRAWMSQFVTGIPYTKWAFNGDKIRFRPSFWKWIFGERIGKLILGVWGAGFFMLGIIKKQSNPLLLSMLLGTLLYLCTIATANVRHDYYQTYIIPPISLALAFGVKQAWNFKNSPFFVSRGVVVFSIFLMLLMGTYEVKENYKINHSQIIAAGRKADEMLPKDALVIAPYNGNTAFLYQTRRWGWPVVDESIEGMIAKGADYYISVNKGDNDTQTYIKRYKTIYEENDFVIIDLNSKVNL